jgi:MoxR-like ATPase
VGKNKLVDRFLQLARLEREYIQLHRDTTVQSLTLCPSLESGVVVWKDSPLVAALKHGRVLMVDEADKAPVEVVCVLKALISDGEVLLTDGRRFVTPKSPLFASAASATVKSSSSRNNNIYAVKSGFRVIALANPATFPFVRCGGLFWFE